MVRHIARLAAYLPTGTICMCSARAIVVPLGDGGVCGCVHVSCLWGCQCLPDVYVAHVDVPASCGF